MRPGLIFIYVFLLSTVILPQSANSISLKGKIMDAGTGAPLSDVNVFLSNTTIGTTSDNSGRFTIKGIPFGTYNIIFSYIGYETEKRNFYSYKQESFEFNILLKHKPIDLKQVSVTGIVPADWKDNLQTFMKIFLGVTENAGNTKILNPEVLDFSKDKKTNVFKARADSVVRVENKALGYMLYIVLDSLKYYPGKNYQYTFYPRFKELTPVSEEEKKSWDTNRQQTFLNSPKHFFYSLVHRQLEKDYYALQEGNINSLLNGKGTNIFQKDLNITCNNDSSIYVFNFTGGLKVSCFMNPPGYLDFYYSSVSIDKFGNLLSPFYSVEIFGAWSDQGIADLLPENYIYRGN